MSSRLFVGETCRTKRQKTSCANCFLEWLCDVPCR